MGNPIGGSVGLLDGDFVKGFPLLRLELPTSLGAILGGLVCTLVGLVLGSLLSRPLGCVVGWADCVLVIAAAGDMVASSPSNAVGVLDDDLPRDSIGTREGSAVGDPDGGSAGDPVETTIGLSLGDLVKGLSLSVGAPELLLRMDLPS